MKSRHALALLTLLAGLVPAGRARAADCATYTLYSISNYVTYLPGSLDAALVGSPSGCQHAWTATSNHPSWLSVTPASGNASATLHVSWLANADAARTGTITVVGEYFSPPMVLTVNQAEGSSAVPCTSYSLSPSSASPTTSAGSQAVSVVGSPSGCSAGSWTATSGASWIAVGTGSGYGPGSVTVSWTQNTGAARSGTATIAGKPFAVHQAGVSVPTCTSFSISPPSASATAAAGSQAVTVTGAPAGCTGGSWAATSGAAWISVNPTSGSGSGGVTASWTQNTGSARSGTATIAGKTFSVNQAAGASSTTLTIPSSASIHGNAGVFFHTDLWAMNRSYTNTLTVTAKYRCFIGQSCGSGTKSFQLGPRQSILYPDVVGAGLFLSPETAGAIELTYNPALGQLSAGARVYTPSLPAPTSGTSVPALPASAATTRALFLGLGSNGGILTSGFRSNAGAYNPNASAVSVTFTLHNGATGAVLGAPLTRTWGANEAYQFNDIFAFASAGSSVTTNAYLVVTSSAPVFPFVTVIDNKSGDSVWASPGSDEAP